MDWRQENEAFMAELARKEVYIPWMQGYGARGAGRDIPPYSTLIFEIELLGIA